MYLPYIPACCLTREESGCKVRGFLESWGTPGKVLALLPSLREGKSWGHIPVRRGSSDLTTQLGALSACSQISAHIFSCLCSVLAGASASNLILSALCACSRDPCIAMLQSGQWDPPQGIFGVPRRQLEVALVPGRVSFPCPMSPWSSLCLRCAGEAFHKLWFLLGAFKTCSCNAKQDVSCRMLSTKMKSSYLNLCKKTAINGRVFFLKCTSHNDSTEKADTENYLSAAGIQLINMYQSRGQQKAMNRDFHYHINSCSTW